MSRGGASPLLPLAQEHPLHVPSLPAGLEGHGEGGKVCLDVFGGAEATPECRCHAQD